MLHCRLLSFAVKQLLDNISTADVLQLYIQDSFITVYHIVLADNMAHHNHSLTGEIYRKCDPVPEDTPKVRGYDFNQGLDHRALLQSYLNTGLQATRFGLAVQEINSMVRWVLPQPDLIFRLPNTDVL